MRGLFASRAVVALVLATDFLKAVSLKAVSLKGPTRLVVMRWPHESSATVSHCWSRKSSKWEPMIQIDARNAAPITLYLTDGAWWCVLFPTKKWPG